MPTESPATGSPAAVVPAERRRFPRAAGLTAAATGVLCLAVVSMFIGVSDVSLSTLLAGDSAAWDVFWISRVPRTLSVVLTGMALSIAGLILQLMVRNKFVEPSTVGTVESASLGILVVTIFLPAASLFTKMSTAVVFAAAGTALFLRVLLLRRHHRHVRRTDHPPGTSGTDHAAGGPARHLRHRHPDRGDRR
ncbi:iron chelate uptake ABC transporter family permease subunit [Arthrobacter sp. Br18]|uniref:iron chelate uptake ABC transporter family permease subunit n=1 Tax=Arthrobacter sp. Br18 TaxID=1312954 RepID=UPI0004ACF87C|nr:iron chelate uptake ABC transporter family permease subunit [Arthrobacter sp. Br18]